MLQHLSVFSLLMPLPMLVPLREQSAEQVRCMFIRKSDISRSTLPCKALAKFQCGMIDSTFGMLVFTQSQKEWSR